MLSSRYIRALCLFDFLLSVLLSLVDCWLEATQLMQKGNICSFATMQTIIQLELIHGQQICLYWNETCGVYKRVGILVIFYINAQNLWVILTCGLYSCIDYTCVGPMLEFIIFHSESVIKIFSFKLAKICWQKCFEW